MEAKTLRKLQLTQLKMLKEVDRVCKKNDIDYFVTWGTALGAIRHSGFIPWDDDIDISMTFENYIKFSKVAISELDSKYFFQSVETDEYCFTAWNKIRINNTTLMDKHLSHMKCHYGICMDVFPLIGIPDSVLKRKIQKLNALVYRALVMEDYLKYRNGKTDKKMKVFFNLIPNKLKKYFKKKSYMNVTKYKTEECQYWGEILSEPYDNAIFNKNLFEKGRLVNFEDFIVNVPEKVNQYLTQCYGEYMKLPKEEDRVAHCEAILDFDKSYEEYQVK